MLVEQGASDLHIGKGAAEDAQAWRRGAIREEPVTRDEAAYMLSEIRAGELAAFRRPRRPRFRLRDGSAFAVSLQLPQAGERLRRRFRLIPTKIATLEQLGIPPVVKDFGHLRGGLVLVTGPTGSGKSTTLAALIDYINDNFSRHCHDRGADRVRAREQTSIITQREVPVKQLLSRPA